MPDEPRAVKQVRRAREELNEALREQNEEMLHRKHLAHLEQLRVELMAYPQETDVAHNKVDVSGNDPETQRLAQPGGAKPAVTAEQYARGREVLDALPPGVYLKCSSCFKWQMGGDIAFHGSGGFLCERCA